MITLICLVKDGNFVWRSMIAYLLITCIVEILGIYIAKKVHNNNWVYNIFLLFETGFNSLMFAYLLDKYLRSKLLIISGLALFSVLYLLGLIDHGFLLYNNLTYTVMSVIYVFYSLYYYYYLIKDESYINLKHSPEFWWVAGTLFFYFSTTVCNLFDEKLEKIMITKTQNISYFIFQALNIILYGCWSYSFICRRWATTISNS